VEAAGIACSVAAGSEGFAAVPGPVGVT